MTSIRNRQHRRSARAFILGGALLAATVVACSTDAGPQTPRPDPAVEETSAALTAAPAITAHTPVGIAIETDVGQGIPLRVKRGQTFYLNQIDLRASVAASVDEDVAGLDASGDFKDLRWTGIEQVDQEFVLSPSANGKYTRRRFYRGAKWMEKASSFTVQPRDSAGRPVGERMEYRIGVDQERKPSDDFFDRRLRAIQWTYDCTSLTNCDGAQTFSEEALVELRYAMHPERTFELSPRTASLEVSWSAPGAMTYSIPVTQVDCPEYDYGFKIDLDATTPPRDDGTYAPGTDIGYRVTLRDGNGKRLHPKGSLPTYNEVIFGANDPGIQYYRAFFDPTTTYYRRKHRERMFMSQIMGPAQDIQPIRTLISLEDFLAPPDVQTTGTETRDGVYAQFRTIPTAHDLFGGNWDAPVPDTWTYHLPGDAKPGTYLVTTKARRVYLGEDIPKTTTVEIQVGTRKHTEAKLGTGPCNSCHSGESSLGKILHANDNRAACASCHAPLGFEYEGPVFVRTHFIHSRSERFGADLSKCSSCHLTKESIQRTSKAACLSCHKSYPQSHVQAFGAIESMYVGGGPESFGACTSSCHTNHPGSGIN